MGELIDHIGLRLLACSEKVSFFLDRLVHICFGLEQCLAMAWVDGGSTPREIRSMYRNWDGVSCDRGREIFIAYWMVWIFLHVR